MILEDFSKRKQDFRTKKLKYFIDIFNKKLKYANKTQQNKLSSKEVKKKIFEINKKRDSIFQHYLLIEKELIEYIAILNAKNHYKNISINHVIDEINNDIIERLSYLQKKILDKLEEHKNEFEIKLYKYQIKKDKENTENLLKNYRNDLATFHNSELLLKEIQESLPKYKILEKECQKLEQINLYLKAKYNTIKIEQKCLYIILDKEKKGTNNKNNLYRNQSYIIKTKYKLKSNGEMINSSKLKQSSNSFVRNNSMILNKKNDINQKRNKKFFISQKSSNNSKIFFKKIDKNYFNIQRCTSAKPNERNNFDKIINEDNEYDSNKNKYIIKRLKELNYYAQLKNKEIEKSYSKEIEHQNNLKNLIQLCVEDLNNENKKNNNDNKNKNIYEEKIFILSYLYDNCINNGKNKELKNDYCMFVPKK